MSITISRSLERATLGWPFRLRTILNFLLIIAGTILLALGLIWMKGHHQSREMKVTNRRNLVFADEQLDIPRPPTPRNIVPPTPIKGPSDWNLAQKEIASLSLLKGKLTSFMSARSKAKLSGHCLWMEAEEVFAKVV